MNEAEILARTYFDTMDTYRPYKTETVDGDTVFKKGLEGKKICDEVTCSLSYNSGMTLVNAKSHYETDTDYKIFTHPYIDVKENDYIVLKVITSSRVESYHLKAGNIRFYESHIEINANEVKEI